MKLALYIMTPELFSAAYFMNPSHQSVCLYVCPFCRGYFIFISFICDLLNEATSDSEGLGSNDRMIPIRHLKMITGAKPAFSWRD
jgi:hypothetical protein